jgi:hypothetical protein
MQGLYVFPDIYRAYKNSFHDETFGHSCFIRGRFFSIQYDIPEICLDNPCKIAYDFFTQNEKTR